VAATNPTVAAGVGSLIGGLTIHPRSLMFRITNRHGNVKRLRDFPKLYHECFTAAELPSAAAVLGSGRPQDDRRNRSNLSGKGQVGGTSGLGARNHL
jgi:hypothetical protein